MNDPLLKWRPEFPILEESVYMISNSLGAMPRGVFDEMQDYAEKWATRGVRAWSDAGWFDMPLDVGDLVAPIIGADPGTISMHTNVSLAQAIILSCFDFGGARNKVVTTDLNFPSVLYVYQKTLPPQAEMVMVKSDDGITIDTEKLLEAIDERTLLVPISHVLFRSAFIQDAQAIVKRAHEVGAMVVLDTFHSAGVIPFSVKELGVDFAVGGVLKWLCGGPGGVFLYVRPDLVPTLEPRVTGWFAHAAPFDFEVEELRYRDGPGRFLNGTPQIACLYAARPGLEIIREAGLENIRTKSKRQTALLIELAEEAGYEVIAPRNPERRGGTVAVNCPHAFEVRSALIARDVVVDYRPNAGIRVSPHFYTTDDEIEQVVTEITDILESGVWKQHAERSVVT
jgi:kynureninase